LGTKLDLQGSQIAVRNSSRLREKLDAKPSNPIFAQFWLVFSDQKPTDRENSP
jgi:hypothetical protein